MNSISNTMIISEALLDSNGHFNIEIGFLPKEDNLFRIHLVKKGYPPNTLIIGGKDENSIFFLANRDAKIYIKNNDKKGLFKDVTFSGYANNTAFQLITEIVASSDNEIVLTNSISKKELIEKATSEQLRIIADTCKKPLVSLYAMYESDFESNYSYNLSFYKSYLKRWKNNHSTYFETFRNDLPITKNRTGIDVLFGILLLLSAYIIYTLINKKNNNQIKKLSIQERKILTLLQAGLTNQQISDECNIGLSTVKSHVSSIFSKLNVKSRKDVIDLKK
ncbi:response regulator transcription factor [Saccharicrinis sp. FJH62]|uniref:response regulator transcription factor n=1 Tax=Saccharicrinis sp. FJH62 TaxID=3344657 RepID=UPI0035D496C3